MLRLIADLLLGATAHGLTPEQETAVLRVALLLGAVLGLSAGMVLS